MLEALESTFAHTKTAQPQRTIMLDYLATMYRDPLFGITILVGIIVILVFADYGRNRYRAKKRQIALENFTKSYDGTH